MIIKDPEKKKELDRIPDVDENGDPIYKIDKDLHKDTDVVPQTGESVATPRESKFQNTELDLKDDSSQE